jgi:hypothetical protein
MQPQRHRHDEDVSQRRRIHFSCTFHKTLRVAIHDFIRRVLRQTIAVRKNPRHPGNRRLGFTPHISMAVDLALAD